jgi:hypothetical protein
LYKKLFEFPVERDFANEKVFTATQYPSIFQTFFRIPFFDIEVRFFGTAINSETQAASESDAGNDDDDDDPVIQGIFRPRNKGVEKQRLSVFFVQDLSVATGYTIQHWYEDNTIFIIFTAL